MKSFADKFFGRFHRPAHPLARHAYDATMLVATALDSCKLNEECAKDRLYQIKNYPGASGVFSIDPDGGTTREFVLKTIAQQQFVKAAN